MKGRTVIMIAHRLSAIRDANLILVIVGGAVAESDSHDECSGFWCHGAVLK
jgi:ABC-type multidrug transport system fused ATPase/permease subunit